MPEENVPEENAPEENAPEENAPEESGTEGQKSRRGRNLIATLIFGLFICAILALLSVLFAPPFGNEAKYSVQGSYELPKDTVEVVALGPSTLRRGFSPAYAFESRGIVAYNSCTDSQPPIASYYLLKDFMKSQGSSLKLVMLEASSIVKNTDFFNSSTGSERVFASMRPSLTKLEFLMEMTNRYEEVTLQEYLIPAIRYHSRWPELSAQDFGVTPSSEVLTSFRGQPIYPTMFMSNISRGNGGKYSGASNALITDEREQSADEIKSQWNEISVHYVDEIAKLCEENGAQLLLINLPTSVWSDALHDGVSLYAEERGIPYIDMSVSSIWDECDLSYDREYYDAKHPNLLGSKKITEYLVGYLSDRYDLADKSADERCSYMNTSVEKYEQAIEDASLVNCYKLEEYLDLINRERYTTFVAVNGEAADGLSDEARKKFEELDFTILAALETGQSYAGVMNACHVTGKTSKEGKQARIKGQFDGFTLNINHQKQQSNAKLSDQLWVTSRGNPADPKGSVTLDGVELSEAGPGINFVVYNNETGLIVDTSCFNTHVGSDRVTDLAPTI